MSWSVKPVNKRVLLERVEIDTSQISLGGFNFVLPDNGGSKKYEFFKVLDIDTDCVSLVGKLQVGDLVVSENAMPIGKFGVQELFVSPENAITAILKEKV